MPSGRFINHVAIIPGAGQVIGFEIARQLAIEGAVVMLNDIDETKAKQATDKINKEGICHAMTGDASEISFIRMMINETVSRFGKLNIAIANAGITLFGDFFNYKPEHFEQVMKVNLQGSFFLAQAAAAQMKKQKDGGS